MKDVMVTNILLLVKKPLEFLLQKWKRTKRHKTKRNKASNRAKNVSHSRLLAIHEKHVYYTTAIYLKKNLEESNSTGTHNITQRLTGEYSWSNKKQTSCKKNIQFYLKQYVPVDSSQQA